jgi:hypothetical protein
VRVDRGRDAHEQAVFNTEEEARIFAHHNGHVVHIERRVLAPPLSMMDDPISEIMNPNFREETIIEVRSRDQYYNPDSFGHNPRMTEEEMWRQELTPAALRDFQRDAVPQAHRHQYAPAGTTISTEYHNESADLRAEYDRVFSRAPIQQPIANPYPDSSAKAKAHKALLDVLSKEERAEYEAFGTITIHTEYGAFRVDAEKDEMGGGGPPVYNVMTAGERMCFNVGQQTGANSAHIYPRYDHIVAQVLMIKSDPKKFMKVANKKKR